MKIQNPLIDREVSRGNNSSWNRSGGSCFTRDSALETFCSRKKKVTEMSKGGNIHQKVDRAVGQNFKKQLREIKESRQENPIRYNGELPELWADSSFGIPENRLQKLRWTSVSLI